MSTAQMLSDLVPIFLTLILLGIGWAAGTAAERRHLAQLAKREIELQGMITSDVKSFVGGAQAQMHARLVHGQAVIACDYMKAFLAGLVKIFGGELRSYQSLMTRARREAMVRMLEEARKNGYDAVCNVRIDSVDIGSISSNKAMVSVEAFAYGTAYRRAQRS